VTVRYSGIQLDTAIEIRTDTAGYSDLGCSVAYYIACYATMIYEYDMPKNTLRAPGEGYLPIAMGYRGASIAYSPPRPRPPLLRGPSRPIDLAGPGGDSTGADELGL